MAEDLARATNAAITGSSPIPVVTATSGRRGLGAGFVLGVGSALAVVAVVISAVVVAQNLGSGGPVVQGHGVAIIDATTNLVTATVTLAAEPTAIAADGTAGWVAHFDTSSVSRVDADDHAVANISVGDGPQAIVAGDLDEADQDPGRVWTANATGETLSTIEADDPQGTPSTLSLQFRPGAMAFGNGGLWVIEPQTDSVRDIPLPGLGELAVEVGAEPIAIAAGDGTVWTANRIGQSLSRFTVGLTSADAPIARVHPRTDRARSVEQRRLDRRYRWGRGRPLRCLRPGGGVARNGHGPPGGGGLWCGCRVGRGCIGDRLADRPSHRCRGGNHCHRWFTTRDCRRRQSRVGDRRRGG